MSNDPNTEITTTDSATLSEQMPAFVASTSSSGYTLMPEVKLPARKYADKPVAKGLTTPEGDFTEAGYIGQNLVNAEGVISRSQYSEDEAYSELASMPANKRRLFQNALYSVGAYGKTKPSNSGFNSSDFSAMREAMLVANAEGVTLDVAVGLMATKYGGRITGGGTAKRIRTTPKQDLTAVFRQAASSVLGRQLSDSEINKFVKSYNRMEVAEGTGGAIAPNVSVAAEQFVKTGSPEEAQAMGALTLTNIIDNAIKGLG